MPDSNTQDSNRQGSVPKQGPVETDSYQSFLEGHLGNYHKTKVIPKGRKDDTITSITHLVLKPDGEFFSETFASVAPGTVKGDYENRHTCLLRYMLFIFPGAQIIQSGRSNASFHIVIPVDNTVSDLVTGNPDQFKKLLNQLRIMAFCDQIGHGIVTSQSARMVGSINSKTGRIVREIQPATTTFSLAQLQEMVVAWFRNPTVYVFRRMFGVPDDERTRCPFHDSSDKDLAVGTEDSNEKGLACFGDQCVQDRNNPHIPMMTKEEGRPSLAKLLLSNEPYRSRWSKAFKAIADVADVERRMKEAEDEARLAGKELLVIKESTTTDDILAAVCAGFSILTNLYCDSLGNLITVETNTQTDTHVLQRHDTVEKMIALVERIVDVRLLIGRVLKALPLPHARAAAVFHQPGLRADLRLLVRISQTPVLDVTARQIQPPGYDPNTKIFYSGPPLEARIDGLTPRLDKWLSGWTGFGGSPNRSCLTDRDIAHIYAAPITEVLADSNLYVLHGHPCIESNQKNAGKDKISAGLGILRECKAPVDLEHYDANRINQGFGNGVVDGRRVFQVTNVECNADYKNPHITRWATEEQLRGAKHGGGNWIADPNTTTFVITKNRGTLYYDLDDRFYKINLEIEGEAGARAFAFDPVEYVAQYRLEIITEVMGLYLLCLNENREWEIPAGTDRRFLKWLKVIGTILERRGLRGFMQKTKEDGEVNEDREHMTELVRRLHTNKKFEWAKAKEILALCHGNGASGPGTLTLFPAIITQGARPECALGRYVLLRMVGQTFRLGWVDETEGMEVQFIKGEDRIKSGRYKLLQVEKAAENNTSTQTNTKQADETHTKQEEKCGISGIKNDFAGSTKILIPQVQVIDINGFTEKCGISGINSLESTIAKSVVIIENENCSIEQVAGIDPADPADPAKTVEVPNTTTCKDSWGGFNL